MRSIRRIPLSRRSHITGFDSHSSSGDVTEHESALERDFVLLTAFQDSGARIASQPVTLSLAAPARRYTPDYWVEWSDGRRELIEVKYRADLREQWPRLRPAFIAARNWARENGGVFRIATERSIRRPLLGNARRLLPLRTVPLDQSVAKQLRTACASLREPTFGLLLAAVSSDRAQVLAALWRMIARGQFCADLTKPIGLQTRLTLK